MEKRGEFPKHGSAESPILTHSQYKPGRVRPAAIFVGQYAVTFTTKHGTLYIMKILKIEKESASSELAFFSADFGKLIFPPLLKAFLLMLCLAPCIPQAADTAIEGLEAKPQTVPVTEEAALLNELTTAYWETVPGKTIAYGKRAIDLARKIGDKKAEADASNNVAVAYSTQSNYDTALKFHTVALEIRQKLGDKKDIAASSLKIGIVYWRKGDYGKALDYCLKAIRIYEELGDKKGIAKSLHNIGIVHDLLGNYDKAIDNHQKALKLRQEIGDKMGIADSLNNIGIVNYFSKNYEEALKYYLQSSKIREKLDDKKGLAKALNNLGMAYTELKQYDKALEYYLDSVKLRREIHDKDKSEMANIHNNIGLLYMIQKNYDKALEYLEKAREVAKKLEAKELIRENYDFLSKLYSAKNDYKQALAYYKQASEVKWSIYTEDSQKAVADMQAQYETEKKEKALELLKKDNDIQRLALDRQEVVRNSLIGGFTLVFILALVLYNRYRMKQIANTKLEAEKAKSDKLLLNILPVRVANDLKETGKTEPESFENVTVYFSDVVGFTNMSSNLEPKVLIDELNDIFTAFDNILEDYQCERVKTIGDAYLCVCGMPDENPHHAENIVKSAIRIIQYLRERNKTSEIDWRVRIGIHTGKVVGGVVGVKKYIYDVFGDTINTASRMESNSEPMKINISETTYQIVKDKFKVIPRGALSVKGKGEMQMYFVEI